MGPHWSVVRTMLSRTAVDQHQKVTSSCCTAVSFDAPSWAPASSFRPGTAKLSTRPSGSNVFSGLEPKEPERPKRRELLALPHVRASALGPQRFEFRQGRQRHQRLAQRPLQQPVGQHRIPRQHRAVHVGANDMAGDHTL